MHHAVKYPQPSQPIQIVINYPQNNTSTPAGFFMAILYFQQNFCASGLTRKSIQKGGESKMIKRIAAAIGSAAMLASTMTPALAFYSFHHSRGGMDMTFTNDDIVISNTAKAEAETGENDQTMEGSSGGTQNMTTGAAWAGAGAFVTISNKLWSDCGCLRRGGDLTLENTDITVANQAEAEAETGENDQTMELKQSKRHHGGHHYTSFWGNHSNGSSQGTQNLTTGDAHSESIAEVSIWNLVELNRSAQ